MAGKKVILINMPWAPVNTPSIQLGLLKSCLRNSDIESSVLYANLIFSIIIGNNLYESIIRDPSDNFFAEWLFNNELTGRNSVKNDRKAIGFFHRKNRERRERAGLEQDNDFFTNTFGKDFEEKILHLRHVVIPAFINNIIDKVIVQENDIIGFTCKLIQTVPSLVASKKIKERFPDKLIVFGGASVWGELGVHYLKLFPWIDCVALGEGEKAFPQIIQNFRYGRFQECGTVNNICFRSRGKVTVTGEDGVLTRLDSKPAPDYSDYCNERKKAEHESNVMVPFSGVPFEGSRGCSWGYAQGCNFCGQKREMMKYRTRSPEKVYREVVKLSKRHGSLNFFGTDLLLHGKMIKRFFPRILELDCNYSFFFEARADLSREDLTLLASSGIHVLQVGIESFNSDLLMLMNKGTTALRNVQMLKWCSELGIKTLYNILYRVPGEIDGYYHEMIDTMTMLYHLQPPLAMPVPVDVTRDSLYYNNRKKFNIVSAKPAHEYKLIYPGTDTRHIAYYFDWSCAGKTDRGYVPALHAALRKWNEAYDKKIKPCLIYRKGPGFVEVIDRRFHGETRIVLRGLSRDVFLFCDEIKSLREIEKFMGQMNRPGIKGPSEKTADVLEWLVAMKLFLREDDMYLCLAMNNDMYIRKNVTFL